MNRLKTLIVIDNLHTGGVATSLYNFLYFVHSTLDIHLMVFNEESIDKTKIPDNVKVLTPCRLLHVLGKNHSEIKKESFALMIFRLVMIFIARYVNGVVSRNLLWPFIPKIGEYDLAIAYAQDDRYKSISKGCIDYIVKKVNVRHRVVIVHCDYKNFGGYDSRQIKMFDRLDNILCVSQSCVSSFVECFPELKHKTIALENFTNFNEIRQKAGEGIEYPKDKVNFVSICRLSSVKGLYRTIKAFAKIYKSGITNFTWTIVGDGPEYTLLNNLVEEENLTSLISFVGNKDNPYPYLKNASCFLLPSIHEAAPMVFGEAASLGIPIISTETCSAIELVQKRGYGLVVSNNDEGILKGLRKFILDRDFKINIAIDNIDINKWANNQFIDFIRLV